MNHQQKVPAGHLHYPVGVRDTAKSGMGQLDNRPLRYLVEFLSVNVGGLRAEASSPPVKHASVGGLIVVGGWESQLHGEGDQLVGISKQSTRMGTGRNLL